MSTVTIEEDRLEEFIDKTVQKYLKTNLDDIDEIRRSPAGAIVRIETRLDAIEKNIETNVSTKTDLANLKTELSNRIGKTETELSNRISKLETGQKLIFAFLLSIIALLIKALFFP